MEKLLLRGRVGSARVRLHKGKYWELDFGRYGGSRKRHGKRFRLYRTTATAAYRTAIEKTREIKEHGQLARQLSTAQRFEAAVCFKKLEPLKMSLTEAVDAVVKKHPLGGNGRTILEVTAELVAKKKAGNRRPRYVDDLDWKLRSFEKSFPGRHVATITTEDMETFIASHKNWSPVTQRSYVQAYNVFVNYSVKRGYRTDNPCQKLELPEIEDKEPVIFTVEQAQRAMRFAEVDELSRECIPWLAIGMFAGIRPEEIEKLQWEQVDLANKTITVTGANAKCRARRIVDICPSLLAWLTPIAKATGAVLETSVRVLRVRARTALGLKRWPHDVLRHSFGSYHFAAHRNEALTRNQMGHSDDGRMFFNHYRALVQPAAAKAFWEIYP